MCLFEAVALYSALFFLLTVLFLSILQLLTFILRVWLAPKKKLKKKWRVSFETLLPGLKHGMPPVSDLVLANEKNDAPSSENCNPARKVREFLDARTGDACKNSEDNGSITLRFTFKTLSSFYCEANNTDDSSNEGIRIKVSPNCHLRNVWLGCLSTAFIKHMQNKLNDDSESTTKRSKANVTILSVIRNTGRFFGLERNHPEGSGVLSNFLYTKDEKGSRQDIV